MALTKEREREREKSRKRGRGVGEGVEYTPTMQSAKQMKTISVSHANS